VRGGPTSNSATVTAGRRVGVGARTAVVLRAPATTESGCVEEEGTGSNSANDGGGRSVCVAVAMRAAAAATGAKSKGIEEDEEDEEEATAAPAKERGDEDEADAVADEEEAWRRGVLMAAVEESHGTEKGTGAATAGLALARSSSPSEGLRFLGLIHLR
jgi:hypothetical protein